MKLAFVVQRYGLEIAGGAEFHCRLIAEHMARHAEVEVLTTCASDYVTWANHYPEGRELLGGVPVRRFRVKRPRVPERFADWSARVLRALPPAPRPGEAVMPAGVPVADPGRLPDELRWLEEEGPWSPRLVRHLREQAAAFDFFIFFSYRYYTTYHGLRAVSDKALLVPTAEDDGIYRLSLFPPFFHLPRAIVYNSVEERAMIEGVSGNVHVPGDVVGVGSRLPNAPVDARAFRARHGLPERFVLYVGRIDENKGCRQLFDFFRRYRAQTGSTLVLALIGKPVIPIPQDAGIRHLGFLSDAEKWEALEACELLLMPSRYESLSMVTLEAWWARRPVLANARCDVLRGQCQRSRAGLYYAHFDEFVETLQLLERDAPLRRAMGDNGRRYFEQHYAWDVIERKYLDLLARAAEPRPQAPR
jgi:glycosyltransferase involved in cell wall biosynthesis